MPSLTFPVTVDGLAVSVLIGLDGNASHARLAKGQPILPPVKANGLLDTGCNVTAVAAPVLQQLALPQATTGTTQTAGGTVNVQLYSVSLSIYAANQPGLPTLVYPTLLVSELTTTLTNVDVLVGLDVLLGCRLFLDGPARQFTLDF